MPEVAKQYKQLQKGKGAESENLNLRIDLVLNRREVDAKAVEKSGRYTFDKFYETDELLGLPYQELQTYTSQLSNKDLNQLYGADKKSIQSVTEFLKRSGATKIDTSTARQQRTLSFEITSDKFLKAFTNGKLEFSSSISSFDYISRKGTAKSFLKAQGEGAKDFADTILGFTIGEASTETQNRDKTHNDDNDNDIQIDAASFLPSEVAKAYDFPGLSNDLAGTGARIGLTGTGGNQAMLNWQKSSAFRELMTLQGRDPDAVPQIQSLNPEIPDSGESIEQMLDISILTSIAPGAQIIASTEPASANDPAINYASYASLIYLKGDEAVDVISSSGQLGSETNYGSRALDELFMDAVLRGIPIVIAAGDRGTANPTGGLQGPLQPAIGRALPNQSTGSAAALSVGGTAFSREFVTATGNSSDPASVSSAEEQSTWNKLWTEPTLVLPADTPVAFAGNFTAADLITGKTQFFYAGSGLDQGLGSSGTWRKSSGLYEATYQRDNLTGEWIDTWRSYPDISMLSGGNASTSIANQTYFTGYLNGDDYDITAVSGTSAAAPLTAALLAITASNLKQEYGNKAKLGFVNSLLYELYNSTSREQAFFDVPAGSNNANVYSTPKSPEDWDGIYVAVFEPTQPGAAYTLYPLNGTGANGELDLSLSASGEGFDAATGLGSINGTAFLQHLLAAYANL
ncbi:S8 family serine peptidase [Vulcanococcus sp.]|uniref:S8 family serine peptidase n=1 Tax=Vulcanococcus sp. TaxID=2856995 RepID=UPI003F6A5138